MKKLREKEDCRPYIRMVCVFIIQPIAVFAFYAASALRVYIYVDIFQDEKQSKCTHPGAFEGKFVYFIAQISKYFQKEKERERPLTAFLFPEREIRKMHFIFTKKGFSAK